MMPDNKISNIKARKNARKITCLTAYSYPIAKILDQYCDVILVGDSLGMTIYGHQDTTEVTLDMMINHGKAVVKAAKKAYYEYFLGEIYGWETLQGFGRKRLKPVKRSSRMTKTEFMDYLEQISQRCANMGIVIPEPSYGHINA